MKCLSIISTAIASLTILSVLANADEFEILKVSIQERMPQISALTGKGAIKEGANGFLTPASDAPSEAIKAAEVENAARLRLFTVIAGRTGTSIDAVAHRYATMRGKSNDMSSSPAPLQTGTQNDMGDGVFVPVSEGSSLPLKVLTRPSSTLFADASISSKRLNTNVPGFTPYVVTRRVDGWYQVCEVLGRPPLGWMKSEDVMEWKHHMVVSFNHPDKRNRGVIFKDKAPLLDILSKPTNARKAAWDRFVMEASDGVPGDTVGIEPEGWVRQKNQFYLLPIIDQQEVPEAGQEIMLLKLAAATKERGKMNTHEQQPDAPVPIMDIVFVVDLTRSMGPYVESTLKMLTEIAEQFNSVNVGGASVRFGLWGYRDDTNLCPGIEYTTHNFTPELEDIGSFIKTLGTVQATDLDSIDYAEDVFAGVSEGIMNTAWRKGSVRTMLVVGDAPGRSPGEIETECVTKPRPKGTACNMDALALRELAKANSVYVASFYLEVPRWSIFTNRAIMQFGEFSSNPGTTEPDLTVLKADNPGEYSRSARDFASRQSENLKILAQTGVLPAPVAQYDNNATPEEKGRRMADSIFRNAFMEWNSANKQVKAPRDIVGWMADKDPVDPARMALTPEVLLSKAQLNDLTVRISEILDAILRLQTGGQDFFKELHAVVTIGGRDPGRLRDAKSLKDSKHFPDFLAGLPYKSKIMGMTNDDWREMGATRANQYCDEIQSKIQFYREIYKDASKWQALNPNSDSGDNVAPIPIDMLP